MKLGTKTLVKFYIIAILALVGFAGLLAFWVNTQNSSTESGSQFVETAKAVAPAGWSKDTQCRYQTGGGTCAKAEFQSGVCNFLGANQMCYCGNNGTDDHSFNDGWTYASVNTGKTTPSCFANGATIESVCAGHSGELINPSADSVSCGNPIRCPQAQVGGITINAVCVDNNSTINVSYAVSNAGKVYRQGTTNNTENNLDSSLAYDIYFGQLTEVRNRYPNYPNISLVDSNQLHQVTHTGNTVTIQYNNCTTTKTNTPTPTTATNTPTPTKVDTIPAACASLNVGLSANGNLPASSVAVTTTGSNNTLTRAPEPGEVVSVSSTGTGTNTVLNSYWIRAINSDPTNACNFYIPTVQNGTFVMPNWKTASISRDASCAAQGVHLNFDSGIIIGANYFQNNDVYQNWCANYGPSTTTGFLVSNLNITTSACQNICVAKGVSTRTVQSPNIQINKTLVSANYQPIGSTITFNITVTNTGNVDIRNFTLLDEYDPNYLAFVSSTYRNQPLNPDNNTGVLVGNRRQLSWSNMPSHEGGIFAVGKTMTLTVTFRILKATGPNLNLENDNCGAITAIGYKDSSGQTATQVFNPRRESCAQFDTVTPAALNVSVTKSVLTPSVNVGNEVHYKATILNSDAQRRTYADIDFTDQYDTKYLKPLRVIITAPNGRSATVSGFANTGSLSIPNIQAIKDISGNALGGLAYGQSYKLEIVYMAVAPVSSTCDTVFANVTDNSNPVNGGTSNQAKACNEIVSPTPPNTGANVWLNLIIPFITILGTVTTRKFLV